MSRYAEQTPEPPDVLPLAKPVACARCRFVLGHALDGGFCPEGSRVVVQGRYRVRCPQCRYTRPWSRTPEE